MQKDTLLNESGRTTSPREMIPTRRLDNASIKIPPTYFLAAAGGAVAISLGLALLNKRKGWANFVGNWVPSLLLLAVYEKLAETNRFEKMGLPPRYH